MTDANGQVVETAEYMPFGLMRSHTGTPVTNYKYTDQELDPETGLYYYGARYYDPTIGLFISADTIVQNFSDPQAINRYSYCRNNPLIYVDPSGHLFGIDDILIGAAIGAVIGGFGAAATGGDIFQGMMLGAIGGSFMGAAAGYGFAATAAAGAISGGITSAIAGGDIGKGALFGAIGAAAGYGLGLGLGNLGVESEALKFALQVGGGGVISGTISTLSGGDFASGFISGAVGAAAGYAMGKAIDAMNMKKGVATGEVSEKKAESSLATKDSDYRRDFQKIFREKYGEMQIAKIEEGTNIAFENLLPKIPSCSSAFPKSNFIAPVSDIVLGAVEGGAAVVMGVASGVGLALGPETWAIPLVLGGPTVAAGWDSYQRITSGVRRLGNPK